MKLTRLEYDALMGNKDAQELCVKQDIALPCWCGGTMDIQKRKMLSVSPSSIEGISGGELSPNGQYGYFLQCRNCGNVIKKKGYSEKATKSFRSVEELLAFWNN